MKITEEWARSAPAGEELDRVCSEWLGFKVSGGWATYPKDIHPEEFGDLEFSTSWDSAGPLLEAMGGDLRSWRRHDTRRWYVENRFIRFYGGRPADPVVFATDAPTPQLAIARACAVLVSRGVKKEDLR